MADPATAARTADPAAAPLVSADPSPVPPYLLHRPGLPDVPYIGARSAAYALRWAPIGSTVEKMVEPAQATDPTPHPEQRRWSVLKVPTPKGWTPAGPTDFPPAQLAGSYETVCKLVLTHNRAAIDQDKPRWAAVANTGHGYVIVVADIDRGHRPDDLHKLHPLSENRYATLHDAMNHAKSENRKAMNHAHSPRWWAVVVVNPASDFRNLFGDVTAIREQTGAEAGPWDDADLFGNGEPAFHPAPLFPPLAEGGEA